MNDHPLGLVFDMDGTLVDSGLDFQLIRREMGIADRQPILEAIQQMSPGEADRCREILARHERAGAERATLMPGVTDFLAEVRRRGWPAAVCRPISAHSSAVDSSIRVKVVLVMASPR